MSTQQIIESWENGIEPYKVQEYKCQQCKRPMNIVEYFIGAVCLQCCKKNHAKVTGKKISGA